MALFNILVDIAASTARLESGLQQAQSKISDFADQAERAFKRVTEVAGIGALAEFTERVIAAGAELEHAAVRAGVGGKAFSELSYAAKQSGVGTDQLATAMSKMNRALSEAATGAKAPNEALAALGLNIRDLVRLRPEQQLEAIADRIAKLKTPADKSRVEIELFGRAGAELAPLLEQGAAGIEKLRREAVGLGASLSEETLKNLEGAHEAIVRMESSASALSSTLVGKLAPALKLFLDSLTAAATGDQTMKLEAELQRLKIAGDNIGFLSFSFDKNLGGFGFHTARAARDLQQLAEARLATLKGIEDTVAKFEAPDFSKLLGGSAPGFQKSFDPNSLLVQRSNAEKLFNDKMKTLYDEFDRDTETSTERVVNAYFKQEAELDELRKQGLISAEQYQKRLREILDNALPGVEVHTKKLKKEGADAFNELDGIAQQAAASIQGAFANFLFDPFHGGLKRLAIDFLQTLQKMAAEAAAAKIFEALFGKSDGKGGGGGLGGILGGILGSVFGGGKAEGGLVSAGSTYLVGEEGPELFTAASHGVITPNSALQGLGGSSINMGGVHIDARGADADRVMTLVPPLVAQAIARGKAEMLHAFRRSGLAAPVRA